MTLSRDPRLMPVLALDPKVDPFPFSVHDGDDHPILGNLLTVGLTPVWLAALLLSILPAIPVSAQGCEQCGQNLVVNGSFEDDAPGTEEPQGWELQPGPNDTPTSSVETYGPAGSADGVEQGFADSGGSYLLLQTRAVQEDSSATHVSSFRQVVDLSPFRKLIDSGNAQFLIHADVGSWGPGAMESGQVDLRFDFGSGVDNAVPFRLLNDNTEGGPVWLRHDVATDVGAGALSAVIDIRGNSGFSEESRDEVAPGSAATRQAGALDNVVFAIYDGEAPAAPEGVPGPPEDGGEDPPVEEPTDDDPFDVVPDEPVDDTGYAILAASGVVHPMVALGTGATFADNLAVGGQVPTVLVDDGALTDEQIGVLQQHAEQVLIVGGPVAVPDSVVGQLQDAGVEVTRASGLTRIGTALAIALTLAPQPDIVFLVRAFGEGGAGFIDAAAVTAAVTRLKAADMSVAVLLTPTEELHEQVEAFLADTQPHMVVVAGGTGAVSQAAVDSAGEVLDGGIIRAGGASREQTAAALAMISPCDFPSAAFAQALPDCPVDPRFPLDGAVLVDGFDELVWRLLFTRAHLDPRPPLLFNPGLPDRPGEGTVLIEPGSDIDVLSTNAGEETAAQAAIRGAEDVQVFIATGEEFPDSLSSAPVEILRSDRGACLEVPASPVEGTVSAALQTDPPIPMGQAEAVQGRAFGICEQDPAMAFADAPIRFTVEDAFTIALADGERQDIGVFVEDAPVFSPFVATIGIVAQRSDLSGPVLVHLTGDAPVDADRIELVDADGEVVQTIPIDPFVQPFGGGSTFAARLEMDIDTVAQLDLGDLTLVMRAPDGVVATFDKPPID